MRRVPVTARAAWLAAALALAACDGPRALPDAPRPLVAHNAKAATTSGLPRLLEQSPATGRGVLIGEWDEGAVRASHVDLAGRVLRRDGTELSQHATHIAGTLIGAGAIDAAARGMAVESRLWSYRWDWDVHEERAAAPFIAASVHAYGVALGWAPAGEGCEAGATFFGGADPQDEAFGAYGESAAELDRMLYETDAISVWAAGNERLDAGPSGDAPHYHYPDCTAEQHDAHADEASLIYGTLGGPISAKNAIAVGATADVEGDVAAELIVPLSFSSFGPTDDGRIKPDLAASGETLYSASADADDAYGVFGGTSSAAAVVAGGVALLSELYRANGRGDLSAAEVKALLVQTAREAGAEAGPDYALGYGLFDVGAAAELLLAAGSRLQRGALRDRETIEIQTAPVDAGTAVRATLAWIDPPGTPGEERAALVNDLDLSLIAPDRETVFHPWRLDRDDPSAAARRDAQNEVDTVERADVTASENVWSGTWTIRVIAREALHRRTPQPISIAASVPLEPIPYPVLGGTRRVFVELAGDETVVDVPILIASRGAGELAWSAEVNASWLELTEVGGLTPSAPTLRIDGSALAIGAVHLASVRVRTGTEQRDIGVVVERACSDECTIEHPPCSTIDLGSALGEALAHGRTAPSPDVQAASCGTEHGARAVFTWQAPHADTFDIALAGAGDAVLYALDAACTGEELACAAGDGAPRISLPLDAGESVALIVDSPADHSFELSIRSARGACFGQCDGTPDRGGCYCDEACVERGDCCEGACEACGRCEPERCGDGEPCDDADPCTEHDVCIGGACAGRPFDCTSAPPDASVSSDGGAAPIEGDDDAGDTADAGADAGPRGAMAGTPGCGCHTVATARPSPASAALALLALVLCSRRRARSP